MFNAVGGSTIHWTAHTPRFHPSDFRVRSLDGVADDWPITYADLEPYYDLNDAWMGCSGIAGDPANPPRSPRPMPPLPLGPDGERIARGFDRLGWHWWPSDSYITSTPYRGRAPATTAGPAGWAAPLKSPRARPTSPTGRPRSPTAWSCGPARACSRSPPDRTAAPPAHATSTATARCSSSRPAR